MKSLTLLLILCMFCSTSLVRLTSDYPKTSYADNEVLYLPEGTALRLLSFGYDNLLSNLLWFNTINYFGRHYKSDRNYAWLSHMCHLVADLNPKAQHVYEFCSLMLSWEVENAEQSISILTKAIDENPTSWRYRYLRGFTYMYFMKDAEKAKKDLVRASKLPNCPPFVTRLAASKIQLTDPAVAANFLVDMIRNTDDPSQRAVLKDKLHAILKENKDDRE